MDCVQIVLNVIEIIILAFTLYYAVRIPKIIAAEQNKIALFDKRYEVFRFYEKCDAFSKALERTESEFEMRKNCNFCFGVHGEKTKLDEMLLLLERLEYNSHQLYFLFPDISDEDSKAMYLALYHIIIQLVTTDKIAKRDVLAARNDYISTFKAFKLKYEEVIFKEIKLCEVDIK